MLRRLLLPLLSCLSLAAAAQEGGRAAETPAAGKVDLVEGDVRIYDPALKPRRVAVGDGVREGESIATGADGELHMQMADGGYIAVRPNTTLRITSFRAQGDDQDKGVFGLLAGGFRSITGWIGRYNPRNYRITTPTATIGVRGTDHEPRVIAEGSAEGEPGTYDKVNAGASYIETAQGRVEVGERRAAFVPQAGRAPPRLLREIPRFFQPGRHEHLFERRHEAIQKLLGQRRDERRQALGLPPAAREGRRAERRPVVEERRQRMQQRQAKPPRRAPLAQQKATRPPTAQRQPTRAPRAAKEVRRPHAGQAHGHPGRGR